MSQKKSVIPYNKIGDNVEALEHIFPLSPDFFYLNGGTPVNKKSVAGLWYFCGLVRFSNGSPHPSTVPTKMMESTPRSRCTWEAVLEWLSLSNDLVDIAKMFMEPGVRKFIEVKDAMQKKFGLDMSDFKLADFPSQSDAESIWRSWSVRKARLEYNFSSDNPFNILISDELVSMGEESSKDQGVLMSDIGRTKRELEEKQKEYVILQKKVEDATKANFAVLNQLKGLEKERVDLDERCRQLTADASQYEIARKNKFFQRYQRLVTSSIDHRCGPLQVISAELAYEALTRQGNWELLNDENFEKGINNWIAEELLQQGNLDVTLVGRKTVSLDDIKKMIEEISTYNVGDVQKLDQILANQKVMASLQKSKQPSSGESPAFGTLSVNPIPPSSSHTFESAPSTSKAPIAQTSSSLKVERFVPPDF